MPRGWVREGLAQTCHPQMRQLRCIMLPIFCETHQRAKNGGLCPYVGKTRENLPMGGHLPCPDRAAPWTAMGIPAGVDGAPGSRGRRRWSANTVYMGFSCMPPPSCPAGPPRGGLPPISPIPVAVHANTRWWAEIPIKCPKTSGIREKIPTGGDCAWRHERAFDQSQCGSAAILAGRGRKPRLHKAFRNLPLRRPRPRLLSNFFRPARPPRKCPLVGVKTGFMLVFGQKAPDRAHQWVFPKVLDPLPLLGRAGSPPDREGAWPDREPGEPTNGFARRSQWPR